MSRLINTQMAAINTNLVIQHVPCPLKLHPLYFICVRKGIFGLVRVYFSLTTIETFMTFGVPIGPFETLNQWESQTSYTSRSSLAKSELALSPVTTLSEPTMTISKTSFFSRFRWPPPPPIAYVTQWQRSFILVNIFWNRRSCFWVIQTNVKKILSENFCAEYSSKYARTWWLISMW